MNSKSPNHLEIQVEQQQPQTQQHVSRQTLPNSSKLTSINAANPMGDTIQQLMEPKPNQIYPMDNYDNFNTLATVAAASPSISPSRHQQQKIYSNSVDQVRTFFLNLNVLFISYFYFPIPIRTTKT